MAREMVKTSVKTKDGIQEKTFKVPPLTIEATHATLAFIGDDPRKAELILAFVNQNTPNITDKPYEGQR